MRRSQQGFTIIELMIATTVLSTMLVLVTAVMISIGNLYYKGVNQARVQDSARTISESITQDLELNDQPITTAVSSPPVGGMTWNAVCMGNVRYSYITNVKIDDVPRDASNNPSPAGAPTFHHILWRDTASGGCTPADLTSNALSGGTELIPDNSRLTAFSVTSVNPDNTGPFHISLAVAYGDNDLTTGSGLSTACKGQTGDQFCATAIVPDIVAVKRIASH